MLAAFLQAGWSRGEAVRWGPGGCGPDVPLARGSYEEQEFPAGL